MARVDGVVVRREDVVDFEVGAVAEEALEVIVVAEALEVVEVQEDSVSAVAVVVAAEDSGEVVVVSEGHDIVFRDEFAPLKSFVESGERKARSGRLKMGYPLAWYVLAPTSGAGEP